MIRRLEDLYVVGKEIIIDDGESDPDTGERYEPVVIWMQKLTPADHATAMKRANAVRATVSTLFRKPEKDQDLYDSIRDRINNMDHDEVVDLVIADDLAKSNQRIEAQVAFEDEWKEENYLDGLKEAWETTALMAYISDSEDPEANRVKSELERYMKQVSEKVEIEYERLKGEWEGVSFDQLVEKAIRKELEGEADLAWLTEYRMCELWLAVRYTDNHRQRYFNSRADIDLLSGTVRNRLLEEYKAISVDLVEGKGSLAVENSSGSSTPPEAQVTEPSSGQQESPV